MRRIGCGLSDVGRRRATNEDAFLVDDDIGLYVVADGIGGHRSGEVASQQAVDTIYDMVKRDRSALEAIAPLDPEGLPASSLAPPPLHRALRLLESAVQAAAYMVYGMAEADPEHEGMGTTISVLALAGSYALTAQVGDSRIYLARGGKAEQLTEDHTLVNQQLKSGELTDAEAKWSRQKHLLTRAVGARDYVNVDTRYLLARPGDGFLLCSDGLHAYVDLELVAGFLKVSPELAAKRFIGIANQRGGRDNITAVVVKLE